MDKSLEDLESRLEGLVPRSLSNKGRQECRMLIDELVSKRDTGRGFGFQNPLGALTASAAALTIGIGGGWYVGNHHGESRGADLSVSKAGAEQVEFEQIDLEAWLVTEDSPNVYVTKTGEIREISREVELTKEVVQHRESGVVVTVETKDHHVVDSVKSEF